MAIRIIYQLWVQAPGIAYTAFFNGVGLRTDRFQGSTEWDQTVNQWAVPGKNTCRILLYAGPRQESLAPEDARARVEFREVKGGSGEPEIRVLASAEWRHEEGKSWPQSVELEIPLKPPFAADWEWTRADVLKEADLKDPKLKAMVENLRAVLAAKDLKALRPLLAVKARELAAAYQIPLESRLQDQDEFFQDFFKDAKWGMRPIAWGKVVQEFHADGRILELMSEGGKPLLASVDLAGDSDFRLGLLLYRIQGEWKLAR